MYILFPSPYYCTNLVLVLIVMNIKSDNLYTGIYDICAACVRIVCIL
jgi:hypothetical protein